MAQTSRLCPGVPRRPPPQPTPPHLKKTLRLHRVTPSPRHRVTPTRPHFPHVPHPQPPHPPNPRLQLLPATRQLLEASILTPAEFAKAAARPVAHDWPPNEWDHGPVAWLISKLTDHPHEPLWRPWFIALKSDPANPAAQGTPGPIVGTVGCKGPPGSPTSDPDNEGAAEIGYGVVTSLWRRRIATEAAAAFAGWVQSDPRVRLLRAHTLHNDPASAGVLRNLGFRFTATIHDPTDGTIDRFERPVPGRTPSPPSPDATPAHQAPTPASTPPPAR